MINGDFYLDKNNLNIEGLKNLLIINEIEVFLFGNEKLGDLQNINDFNVLREKIKELFKIKEEKENLLNLINQEELNTNIKSSINKI